MAAGMNDQQSGSGALHGVRVVELGQFLSAPFGGMIFADLGAEVIKIERPGAGDDGRRMGKPFKGGDSLLFQDLNRGKYSVELDLKTPEGHRDFMALAGTADVIINNLRPGTSAEMQVDAAAVRQRFPRAIYCTLSAMGSKGPLQLQPGFEPLIQAYSGLASVNGFESNPAVRTGPSVVDLGSGMWIVIAAMAALRKRDLDGEGATIDLSLLETSLTWITQDISGYMNEGRQPTRRGNGHPLLVPYDTFVASDVPIMLAVGNDRQFAKFCELIGRGEWCSRDGFKSNAERIANRAQVMQEVGEIIRSRPADYWVAELTRRDVPCAQFNSIPQVLAAQQTEAMNLFGEITSADVKRQVLGLPFTINNQRPLRREPSPKVGQH
ncbi:MAG: CoA transferase, partial [Alcaligenaceae bacterium]